MPRDREYNRTTMLQLALLACIVVETSAQVLVPKSCPPVTVQQDFDVSQVCILILLLTKAFHITFPHKCDESVSQIISRWKDFMNLT